MRYLAIGMLMLMAIASPGQSLKFREVTIDLEVQGDDVALALGGVYFANLAGGPEPEIIVVNGFDSFEIWGLKQGRRPSFEHMASLPLIGPDDIPTPQLFTFARLNKNGPQSLVLADPKGIWHYTATRGVLTTKRELLLAQPLPSSKSMDISFLDFALDIDGDGLDELLLPDIDKPLLWKKGEADWQPINLPGLDAETNSSFSTLDFDILNDAETFPPGLAHFANSSQTPAFYFHDYNQDGKLDLYSFSRVQEAAPNEIEASAGGSTDNSGKSAKLKEQVTIDIHLFAEGGFVSTPAVHLVGSAPVEANSFYTDLNGDGLMDRIEAWGNYDPVAPKSQTLIFLAQKAPSYKIPALHDYSFQSRNPFGDNYLADVNGDGLLDLFVVDVDYMVTSSDDMVKVMLGQSVSLTLKGFLTGNGMWPNKSSVRKSLELRDFRDRGLTNMLTLKHDFTGDGLPDLAFAAKPDELTIYAFEKETSRFSRRRNGRCKNLGHAWTCADLNADGKADVISCDLEELRLIVQLSRQ